MKRDWIDEIIDRVPDYKTFMTVDEMNNASEHLADEYPALVKKFSFGFSRNGEEIIGLKIGSGAKNALIFGMPHPNEPIGTMLIDFLAKELVTNKIILEKLDYTFYIIKAWDIDGTRLNEKWFKGPFTLYNYARNFFRPAGYCQVDWTFPIEYKELNFKNTLPETKAMMDLIDEIKPHFIYSLHNAGFGGVYWYMTRRLQDIEPKLYEAAEKQGVPLNLGEPEAPFLEEFAPAIFKELGIKDQYDYLEKYGIKDIPKALNVGTCSADYANGKYGSFTLLTELPYFFNPSINDKNLTDSIRGDIVKENILEQKQSNSLILESLKKSERYMQKDNPFLLALKAFSENRDDLDAEMKMADSDPKYRKKATVAEVFDNCLISRFYKLLSYGMLIRANEYELENLKNPNEGNKEKYDVLNSEKQFAEKLLKEKSEELEKDLTYEVIPIKKLVSIQLECGLRVAERLN